MSTDMMGGFGWLGMGLMWLWAILPIVLVIGVGWLVANRMAGRERQRSDDAGPVLRRRLAAGEIDLEQYEKARIALGLTDGKIEGS